MFIFVSKIIKKAQGMHQKKICLIGNNLSNGGADKIHAILSNYFFSQAIDVHNIILIDCVTYEFSGELLNLGKLENKNSVLANIEKFLKLKRFLKQNKFDFIIDFRMRNNQFKEFIISKFLYKSPFIITVHSYKTEWYFPKNNFLAKNIFSKAYGIVSVSKEIETKIVEKYHYQNVKTIHNPLEIEKIENLSLEENNIDFQYIIAVGRMVFDNNKQFDKLIEAYSKSDLPKKDIKLVLLGDGPQRIILEQLALTKNIQDKVVFLGFQDNPFKYLAKAKFFVLTSKNEGLPNSITESLACGIPVVSFDCKSGPSELIEDRKNGLLVENQNFEKLTSAMNEMIENTELHSYCKGNAKESIQRFAVENIGKQWMNYLKI